MSSKVIIRKNGGFMCVFGDDSYILYYLLGYKIKDDKVGFPNNAYNKVVNILENNHINYEFGEINIDYKKKNNYDKFAKLGRKKFSLDYRVNDIISKLDKLNEKDIDKILTYVESFLWMKDF